MFLQSHMTRADFMGSDGCWVVGGLGGWWHHAQVHFFILLRKCRNAFPSKRKRIKTQAPELLSRDGTRLKKGTK